MSKYQVSETNMSDPGCLVAALVQMGFAPEVIEQHAEAQVLYDWHGQARPQKAHIIIRRKNTGLGASNDVGFVKNADGKYAGIVSEYDEGSKFNAGWMGKLKQNYAEVRAIAAAKLKGHRLLGRDVVTVNGKEQVKLRFAAR